MVFLADDADIEQVSHLFYSVCFTGFFFSALNYGVLMNRDVLTNN